MRLIGTINDERKAMAFSQFLQKKGIEHQVEIKKNTDWDSSGYGLAECLIWIEDEDNFEEVKKWYQLFVDNPQDPIFQTYKSFSGNSNQAQYTVPPENPPETSVRRKTTPWEKQPMGWITKFLLALCTILYFSSQLWTPAIKVPEQFAGLILLSSPIDKALLFDYPKFYDLLDRFIRIYGFDDMENSTNLPPEGKRLMQQINQTPFWPGFYQLLLKQGWKGVKEGFSEYPTFEKIREGQVWRLFTPVLLHGSIFHILFNMMWLVVLGKQMEQRLSPFRYILFILIVAIFSNTCQYLMSGSNFIGFSGVLCGMLGFIWARQQNAAWEGYQVDRSTMLFMLIFILSMASIQLFSFVLEKFFDQPFSANIANMAHLSGGLAGYLLGRSDLFSWRHA